MFTQQDAARYQLCQQSDSGINTRDPVYGKANNITNQLNTGAQALYHWPS